MTITVFTLLAGMLTMTGLLLAASLLRTPQPALGSALSVLSGTAPEAAVTIADTETATGLIGRIGRWVLTHTRMQPGPRQMATIRLSGMDLTSYYGYRTVFALVLGSLPWVMQLTSWAAGSSVAVGLPAIATIALAVFGWYVPVLVLRRSQTAVTDDTYEAFIVLLDLVVLERLANKSAVDAITHAAFVSKAPLFIQVQRALNRATLENVAPWSALERLAEEIQLPELNDLIAIALLQEQGASLVSSLRARTAELRNASLLRMQNEATAVTQRMTFAKMVPPMSVVVLLIGATVLGMVSQGAGTP